MKHLLKILFLLPFFLSCTNTQEEPMPTPEEEQPAIGFAAKVENSRAVSDMDATENDVKTNGFSVWGGYEGGTTAVFTGEGIILGGENEPQISFTANYKQSDGSIVETENVVLKFYTETKNGETTTYEHTTWEPGVYYIYSIGLPKSATPITFGKPTVDEWKDPVTITLK